MSDATIIGDVEIPGYLDNVPPLSQLTDRFGNTFQFGNAGDFWYPPFPIGADNDYFTFAQQIKSMEIREDDILLASYPKTGSHWHVEIISMLVNKTAKYTEFHERKNYDNRIHMRPMAVTDSAPSPRLLLMKTPFRYCPRQALEKKVKIVYVDRNPKDVLVSYYSHMHSALKPMHYPGTFEHFFHLLMEVGYYYGDIFHYLMEWQEGIEAHPDVPIYTSVYEDLKLDPVGSIVKLNEFLGTGCSKELCEEIASVCNIQPLRRHKEANMTDYDRGLFRKDASCVGFYRKGEIGDWKNWFTVAMNEKFDAMFQKKMSGYKRKYKFTVNDN